MRAKSSTIAGVALLAAGLLGGVACIGQQQGYSQQQGYGQQGQQGQQGYGQPGPGQQGPQGGYGPPQQGPRGDRQGDDTLHVDQSLHRGQSLFSHNGRFALDFQRDGNVVLRKTNDGFVLWDTGTSGSRADHLIMQGDGNCVLYTRDMRPLWSTGITGPNLRHHQEFVVQDDGNLVVYSRGQVYWASNTQRRSHYGNMPR